MDGTEKERLISLRSCDVWLDYMPSLGHTSAMCFTSVTGVHQVGWDGRVGA